MENWSLTSKGFKRTAGEGIGWESEAEQLNTEQLRGTKTNQILDSLNHDMPMPSVGLMLNKLKNVQDLTIKSGCFLSFRITFLSLLETKNSAVGQGHPLFLIH